MVVIASVVRDKKPELPMKPRTRNVRTAMITNSNSAFGIRFALSLVLSAAIAAGYLFAIGYLNPGFVA